MLLTAEDTFCRFLRVFLSHCKPTEPPSSSQVDCRGALPPNSGGYEPFQLSPIAGLSMEHSGFFAQCDWGFCEHKHDSHARALKYPSVACPSVSWLCRTSCRGTSSKILGLEGNVAEVTLGHSAMGTLKVALARLQELESQTLTKKTWIFSLKIQLHC